MRARVYPSGIVITAVSGCDELGCEDDKGCTAGIELSCVLLPCEACGIEPSLLLLDAALTAEDGKDEAGERISDVWLELFAAVVLSLQAANDVKTKIDIKNTFLYLISPLHNF